MKKTGPLFTPGRLISGADLFDAFAGIARAQVQLEQIIASGMEAASAGETTKIGSTEGDSPTAEGGDAQPLSEQPS